MFAKVEKSPRLQEALHVLRAYPNGLTGLILCRQAGIMNPGEVCSELRKNGYDIECVEQEKSPNGRRVFKYRLVGEPNGENIPPVHPAPEA